MAKKQITLAEAKLRQSELQEKAQILKDISEKDIFEIQDIEAARKIKVPKLSAKQVLHEYDWHTRRAGLLFLAIKRAEFLTEILVDPIALEDYPLEGEIKPKVQRKRRKKRQLKVVTHETGNSNNSVSTQKEEKPSIAVSPTPEAKTKADKKGVSKMGSKAASKQKVVAKVQNK